MIAVTDAGSQHRSMAVEPALLVLLATRSKKCALKWEVDG
jgi:hypothetical protein